MKKLIIVLFGICCCQFAQAQKRDTLVYYVKNNGQLVSTKDSCDYYRMIISPDAKAKSFPVKDFYKNGTPKMTGTSTIRSFDVRLTGLSTEFYPTGKSKSVTNNGKMGADNGNVNSETITEYYPNGQLYCEKKIKTDYNWLLVTCFDSTGKALAKNGTGHWLLFDDDYKKIIGEGDVYNGLETGQWAGTTDDSVKYTCTYDKGKITNGTSYDKSGKAYTFTEISTPLIVNNMPFFKYFWHNVKYPVHALENNIQGKVILSFVIENDGTLSHLAVIRSPDKSFTDATLKLFIPGASWIPATHYGIPVTSSVNKPFVLPLSYAMSDGDD